MKSTVDLNGNMIKKVSSGGDTLIGRNHREGEEEFITHFLAVCFANDLPNIKPFDDAVDERVRVVSYKKSYVKEPTNEFELLADPNIAKEIKTVKFQKAFVGLLIQYYTFHNTEIEPVEVLNAKKDWISEDKNIIEKFKFDFDITNDEADWVASKSIEMWITENKLGITMKKFGMEMKKYCLIQKMNKVESINKKINGRVIKVWVGVKAIKEEADIVI
jgi:hypothetical protein